MVLLCNLAGCCQKELEKLQLVQNRAEQETLLFSEFGVLGYPFANLILRADTFSINPDLDVCIILVCSS